MYQIFPGRVEASETTFPGVLSEHVPKYAPSAISERLLTATSPAWDNASSDRCSWCYKQSEQMLKFVSPCGCFEEMAENVPRH